MLLFLELTILFFILPLLVYYNLIPVPKLLILLCGFAYVVIILKSNHPNLKLLPFNLSEAKVYLKRILISLALSSIVLFLIVVLFNPATLFNFPRERTLIWLAVMLLYPVFSAYPQEVIYRQFVFERYNNLVSPKYFTPLLSIISFTFLHIIYDNWPAIILSFIGGVIFTITYKKTKSLTLVTIEHAILGNLVFTIGLGNYFYEPVM